MRLDILSFIFFSHLNLKRSDDALKFPIFGILTTPNKKIDEQNDGSAHAL